MGARMPLSENLFREPFRSCRRTLKVIKVLTASHRGLERGQQLAVALDWT